MNKTILILTLISYYSLALHTRFEKQTLLRHQLNEDLCRSQGGIVCGFAQKDCCAKGCESKYLGLNEQCTDGKMINLQKLTCEKICQNNSGTVYTDKVYGQPKCCKTGSYKNDTCPQAAQIALGECESSTLTDKLVDFVKK